MSDQTLNPFRAPIDVGRPPRRQAEPAPGPSIRIYREPAIVFTLTAFILLAYWGVWDYKFVYFDDPGYVTDNLNVLRGLPLFTDFKAFCASVYWAFTAFEQSNWHPLTWLSHMLDVQIYGLNAGGHHVTNIILHTSNTILLFWLLRILTGRAWCSAVVAVFFAVHPMHVESVVWVAERKDVLSTFLGLLTLLAYVHYAGCPSIARYVPVFVLLALGLLAKPMLVTFPFVCLLLDYWPLRRLTFSWEAGSRRPPPQVERPERSAAPRRRPKRNQRIASVARAPRASVSRSGNDLQMIIRLLAEKIPLFCLSLISAAITPYAQAHGGSMATTSELPLTFRIANSLQSYMIYIYKMFWPGKMMSLHLLVSDEQGHPFVAPGMIVLSTLVFLSLTSLAVAAFFFGRRYVTFGWFWYVGTLVPVIGIVQVGEQGYADRYTYIPYIGLFVAIVWAIGEAIDRLPNMRRMLVPAVSLAIVGIVCVWTSWTHYQITNWRDIETHLLHALDVEPDNWNMLNNYGVYLWKDGQQKDVEMAKAAAEGDQAAADELHKQAAARKAQASEQWLHGIASRPTATDIHSNLGYKYSEENNLDKAEYHLKKAVELKPISPRPHNNLGRVLLRRSTEASAKAKSPAESAAAKELMDAAIEQFEVAVRLDPSLLEARLNLGQVYLQMSERDKAEKDLDKADKDLDKAESEYKAILLLDSPSVTDRETISNFSQAYFGLAQISLIRKKPNEKADEAIKFLHLAIARNPQNLAALNMLFQQHFIQKEYREGEKALWPLLALQPKSQRRNFGLNFIRQFESAGKAAEALELWNFMGWAFATSPEPSILDRQEAVAFAQKAVATTREQDPMSLDTLAAAFAEFGDFSNAVKAADVARNMARSRGNEPLAKAIEARLQFYKSNTPYRCNLDGSDRP
jgi:protein O-mannosyl-transferase